MSKLQYRTIADERPQGKPKVYFACHPDDFGKQVPVTVNRKGYTSFFSRLIDAALDDAALVKKCL